MHAVDAATPRNDSIATGASAGASRAIWLAAAISALGGLLFGYDWVVIGGAKPFYEAHLGLVTPAAQAWAVSCALIGCLLGAVCSGKLSDRLGRRSALRISALIFAISSLGTALIDSLGAFVAWRVAGGIAIGMASGLSPLYIAEIAPARNRGKLVCCNQIAIVIGVLAAQIVNWLIAEPVPAHASLDQIATSWNGMLGWRWMFAAATLPSLAFVLGCFLIPESPRWLVRQGRVTQAHQVLCRLGGERHAEASIREISGALDSAGPGFFGVLREPRCKRALAIGIVLAVLQQWCGINVIFNYAQEIFASAGYAVSDTLFNIVITGIVNCVFTLLALVTVERWGRRRLLLLGCGGLAAVYLVLGGCYQLGLQGWPMLLMVVSAIAIYGMTLAPVTWVALSEIFPGEARAVCMAVATTALWAACFVLTVTFPLLNAAFGTGWTFWSYALICLAGLMFIARRLPETKGRSLEDIERSWR